jgi:iron complex outermembrane receptor protein
VKAIPRSILAMTLPLVLATPAWAAAAAESGASSGGVEEIIVTARRVSENIQKVPIAITAINASSLEKRAIFNDTDLQSAVPGLVIHQSGSANQFNYAIRGQSVDTYTNSPPAVVVYINDVPIVTHGASSLYDLQQIQVLKGPQGTLFGRNTTGGAILYQTAQPGDKFEGYLKARYGNHDSKYVEGAVSIPLGDKFGVRIAGAYTGGGAYQHDILNDRWLGKQNIKSIRGTFTFKPTDNFTNITVVQHNDEGGNNIASVIYSAYTCPQFFTGSDGVTRDVGSLASAGNMCSFVPSNPNFQTYIAQHPALFPGGVYAWRDYQRQLGPYVTDANSQLFHRAKSTYVTNTSTYEVSSDLTIKNIFGFNQNKADDGFDYDSFPYFLFEDNGTPTPDGRTRNPELGYITDTRQYSEELQLQGHGFGGKLNYVIGGFYSHQRDIHDSNLAYSFLTPAGLAPPVAFAYNAVNKDTSKAVFAQGTYKATDKLNITGGFRYTWEKLSQDELPDSVYYPFVGAAPERQKSSSPSWLFSLDYQVTPNLLVYLTHRGSWRTGGYNWNVFPTNLPGDQGGNVFVPEKTKDVEIGLKYSGDDLGVPITYNIDFYNQWTKEVQRAAYVNNPLNGTVNLFTVNVPNAETTGIEVAASIRPIDWLTLGAQGAYTHARFTNGQVNVIGVAGVFGPFADAPKWTGNAYFDVTHDLDNNAGILSMHFELYGQTSDTFSNTANTTAPGTTLPGYILANARLAWTNIMSSKVTAAFYIRNMFDKKYFGGGNGSGPGSGSNAAVPGVSRMFGGELSVKF